MSAKKRSITFTDTFPCVHFLYKYLSECHPVCSLVVQIHTQIKSVKRNSVCAIPRL